MWLVTGLHISWRRGDTLSSSSQLVSRVMLRLWFVWTAVQNTARCVSDFTAKRTLMHIQIVYGAPDYNIPSINACNSFEEGVPFTVSVSDYTFPHSWVHEYGLEVSSAFCVAATYASFSSALMLQYFRCLASTVASWYRGLVGFPSDTGRTTFHHHGGHVKFVGCPEAWPRRKEIRI